MVERLEDVAVRQGRALHRALVRRDAVQPRTKRRFGRRAQSRAGIVQHLEPQSVQRVWQVAGQPGVTADPQFRKLSQFTKFRRQPSHKTVAAQVDRGNEAQRVSAHALPCRKDRTVEPAAGVDPARTLGGAEERFERGHVGLVAERSLPLAHPRNPLGKLARARHAQSVVVLEQQPVQGRPHKTLRDATREAVVAEAQRCQAGQVAEFGRNRARQLVQPKSKLLQAGEVAEFGRDRACKVVFTDEQCHQAGEVAELRWDRARQAVAVETQPRQTDEVAEFGRNWTGQTSGVKTQFLQVGEVADFRRDRARPAIAGEVQPLQVAQIA